MKAKKDKKEEKDEGELITVPISRLYDGMVVTHDIYGANPKLLLIKRGGVLNNDRIRAIRSYNDNKDTINVYAETHLNMLEHALDCTFVKRKEAEEETGYAEIRDRADNVIDTLQSTRCAPSKVINTISEDLSYKLEHTKQDLILDLINALGPIDEYLQRHCIDVSLLNGLIGRWLGMPKEEIDQLVLVGLLHDCGKASLPSQLLTAPRPLSAAEFEVMKMHPVYSYDKLSEFPATVQLAVRHHHERINGGGYPDGCSGDTILPAARITAVSDIYDAMVSRRSYKSPQSPFIIFKQLMSMSGDVLDSFIVNTFIKNLQMDLIGKPVSLSNGDIAIVSEIDPDDIEFPYVRTCDGVVKTSKELQCVSMFLDDE